MRFILTALAVILWLLLGYFVQPCFNDWCGLSDTTDATSISESSAAATATDNGNSQPITNNKITGPLLFNWDKAETVLGDDWETKKSSLLAALKEGEIFEITGQYRADEKTPTGFENMGMARASEIAKLFKPPLTDERIRLRGQLVNGSENDKNNLFKSASFRNLKNTTAIKEIDDYTEIRFPFNSTNKLADREVENYLDDVAERVKKSGERVSLTGHTDNIGSTESNQNLGMRRARIIRDYLVSKGVSSSKIITISEGELQPKGNNSTESGRAQNRRTELRIIK